MRTPASGSTRTRKLRLPLAAVGAIGLGVGAMALAAPGIASAQTSGATTYQANLQPVPLNTPAGAASGHLTLTLNGDQATVSEQVTGLATTLPTDTTTLASLGIPAAFAGKPFPHVQHIHINGQDTCPTAAADTNGDGVISTVEGQPAYGMIGTTLSEGTAATDATTATNVTDAPSGGTYTYNRTFTINQTTLSAIQNNKAVIVVHGLNPTTAPKASLTTANSLNVTLPGATKPLALIGTAPALCGVLTASQMSAVPAGAPQTGGGSTAGVQELGLFATGGALVLGGSVLFAARKSRKTSVVS